MPSLCFVLCLNYKILFNIIIVYANCSSAISCKNKVSKTKLLVIILVLSFFNIRREKFNLTFINELTELLKRKRRAKDDNDLNQLAISCHSLGEYYNEQCDYETALKNFEEAAAAQKTSGSSNIDLGKSHRMIGEMYMLLGDFAKSLKHEQIYLGNVTVTPQ